MARNGGWISTALLLAGCTGNLIAPTPPQAPWTPPPAQPAPRTAQEARVREVVAKLAAANPQAHLQARTVVVPGTDPSIQTLPDRQELRLSEGLVNACATEGQLAAVVAGGLGKLVVDRQERAAEAAKAPTREPPADVRFGREGAGFGEADQAYKAELVKLGYDRRQRAREAAGPDDPRELARLYLRRAGFEPAELEAVQHLVGTPAP